MPSFDNNFKPNQPGGQPNGGGPSGHSSSSHGGGPNNGPRPGGSPQGGGNNRPHQQNKGIPKFHGFERNRPMNNPGHSHGPHPGPNHGPHPAPRPPRRYYEPRRPYRRGTSIASCIIVFFLVIFVWIYMHDGINSSFNYILKVTAVVAVCICAIYIVRAICYSIMHRNDNIN